MDDLKDKIIEILKNHNIPTIEKEASCIMEEIEKYNNLCNMSDEYHIEEITEMKKIIEDQRKDLEKYFNIFNSIYYILEGNHK